MPCPPSPARGDPPLQTLSTVPLPRHFLCPELLFSLGGVMLRRSSRQGLYSSPPRRPRPAWHIGQRHKVKQRTSLNPGSGILSPDLTPSCETRGGNAKPAPSLTHFHSIAGNRDSDTLKPRGLEPNVLLLCLNATASSCGTNRFLPVYQWSL